MPLRVCSTLVVNIILQLTNVDLMLAQRRKRWTSSKPALIYTRLDFYRGAHVWSAL